MFHRSRELVGKASAYVPGGVNSQFRLGIRPVPLVIDSAADGHVTDVDGNTYVDYYLGMGPMLLGHSPAPVVDAVRSQVGRGILYAGQSELEYEAARLLCDAVPSAESVRFGSSGSEMTHAAVRLARAATGRRTVLKFEGQYHGWLDPLYWSVQPDLAAAGEASAPNRVAQSRGQLDAAGTDVEVVSFNDARAVTERLARGDVAAVLTEPVMFNTGGIEPEPGFLEALRTGCDEHGTLLVFDEVITGFRVSYGGAQRVLGVTPDLTVLGKALANGFAVSALVGRRDLMDLFGDGRTVHGGTYNAQAVSMAATVATLRTLAAAGPYEVLAERSGRLMSGLRETFAGAGVDAEITGYPGVFHVRWGSGRPRSYRELAGMDQTPYQQLAADLVERGVRVLARGTWFTSTAHTDDDVDRTLDAVAAALRDAR